MMKKKTKVEKPKYWGYRAYVKHRKIARKYARKFSTKEKKVSESTIVCRALEEFDVNHQND